MRAEHEGGGCLLGCTGGTGSSRHLPGHRWGSPPSPAAPSAPQEPGSNSLTADNLEKLGKLNHSPGVPEDGALLSEAKLQSIISFLDEMEKSEQERPRSAASATQREVGAEHLVLRPPWEGALLFFFFPEPRCPPAPLTPFFFPFPTPQGLLSEEELAHLEQASAVATEVTSSIVRLKLEVEEKKRAISLLQTALVGGSAPPARWGAEEQSPQHPSRGAEAPERGGTALRVGVPIHPPAGPRPAVLPELSGDLWGRGVLGHAVILAVVSMGRILEDPSPSCGLSPCSLVVRKPPPPVPGQRSARSCAEFFPFLHPWGFGRPH